METFTVKNLTFYYPNRELPALQDVSFAIEAGQFVTFCGKSGGGKSTLLRQLKTILTPHGQKQGKILFEGKPLEEISQREQAQKIGYVLQSPENQIVTDKVWHELAFGLESLGFDNQTIRLRVAEMASFFGIQTWFHKKVNELSGGQKQLLNLAAIMAMHPSVLILDEPTSQLDPIAAADFLETLQKINRELGTTILISEHRLEEVLPMSDRVIVIEEGSVLADGTPKNVGAQLKQMQHDMFLAMPTPMRVYAEIPNQLSCPITVREGKDWLQQFSQTQLLDAKRIPEEKPFQPKDKPLIQAKELWFRYEKDGQDIIKGLSLDIYPGEFYAIVGGNGTGKSTTLSLLAGIRKPYRGKILLNGQDLQKISEQERFQGLLGVLPQNPQSLFVEKTVEKDLAEILSGQKLSKVEKKERIKEIAALCELTHLLQFHPYDLSGGEQQRAALAKVLLLEPTILLLDEPTKGLDSYFKLKFAEILQRLQISGTTIIMVSHDVEFCAQYASRCAMFFDGSIVTENTPRKFFSGNNFYTTAANCMARQFLPEAVTANDIILACGGQIPQLPKPQPIPKQTKSSQVSNQSDKIAANDFVLQVAPENRHLSKRTLLATLMILLVIPLTIWFGIYYLDDRKYYFISLLVILETMLPFVMIFESRKPQARELMLIAVLCAIADVYKRQIYGNNRGKPVKIRCSELYCV